MSKNTLTFEIGGLVRIEELEDGISAFRRLVNALTPRNSGVSWVVDDVTMGSVGTTLRGEANNTSVVEEIVNRYESIGDTLQAGDPLSGYSALVVGAAEAMMAITKTAPYVRLATPGYECILSANGIERETKEHVASPGTVTGRVETVSSRGRLHFNIYDSVFDKSVSCLLTKGQEEQMRNAWGRRARVSGLVYREASGGRPLSIRSVSRIEILPEVEPGSFRKARGAMPWKAEYEPGDVVIRRLRDA